MSTKKKISDIGKAMYESCPELGDMSVADMRRAARCTRRMRRTVRRSPWWTRRGPCRRGWRTG